MKNAFPQYGCAMVRTTAVTSLMKTSIAPRVSVPKTSSGAVLDGAFLKCGTAMESSTVVTRMTSQKSATLKSTTLVKPLTSAAKTTSASLDDTAAIMRMIVAIILMKLDAHQETAASRNSGKNQSVD
jgi:hypothetical protein